MEVFQQKNLDVKVLIHNVNLINDIIRKLKDLKLEERFHLQLKEMKKIDPIGLLFWFGCYFPIDFFQLIK